MPLSNLRNLPERLFVASIVSFASQAVGQEVYSTDPALLETGSKLFAQHCAGCHLLAADAIAPPLGGLTAIQNKRELIQWIRRPSEVIASGNERANALLRRYKVTMPSFDYLEIDQIESILAFIHERSTTQGLKALSLEQISSGEPQTRLIPPIVKTNLVVELEAFAEIPRLPSRPAYKGIAFIRPDPREDDTYFVNELMGLLYRLRKDGNLSVFLDVRKHFPLFVYEPGVATGLGSFALHPKFDDNGIFYSTHAEIRHDSPVINADDIPEDVPESVSPPLEWTLSEWTLDDPSATAFSGTRREVLRFVTPTTAHGSQEIDFSPATDPSDPNFGLLYIGCGDGGSINLKRPDMAGHPRTLLGSIMRIDPMGRNSKNGQYGIPPDNPFATTADQTIHREIWAYGFRNPHRFSWDTKYPSRMIAIDIGESNVEEVNLVVPGGSYGWGVGSIEGTTRIDVLADAKVVFAAEEKDLAGFDLPHGQYDHSDGQAVTGGFVYRGPIAALQGKYIFGDIVNGRLLYMNMDNLSDPTIYEIHIMEKGAITSVKELGNLDRAHLRLGYNEKTGDLFLLTKDDGMIRRISMAYYLDK